MRATGMALAKEVVRMASKDKIRHEVQKPPKKSLKEKRQAKKEKKAQKEQP